MISNTSAHARPFSFMVHSPTTFFPTCSNCHQETTDIITARMDGWGWQMRTNPVSGVRGCEALEQGGIRRGVVIDQGGEGGEGFIGVL